MANQIIGCLVVNDLVARAQYPAGDLNFGPVGIPDGFTFLAIMYDLRAIDNLTNEFTSMVDMSFNDGVDWQFIGGGGLSLSDSGYELNGGILTRSSIDPMGTGKVRVFGEMIPLPQSDLTTRQIRGTLSQTEASEIGVSVVAW